MTADHGISLQELKELTAALFSRMEKAGLGEVRVKQPTYWKVFPSDIFASSQPLPMIADLVDDLADLRAEIREADSTTSVGIFWHALGHLSGVLSVLAAIEIEPSHGAGEKVQ